MKILHLLSNWKWTERSELVVDLARAQQQQGDTVTLVCGQAPTENSTLPDVAFNARQKGLNDIIPLPEMTKHWRWRQTRPAIRQLRHLFNEKTPQVVHCHMPNAHLLAGLAGSKSTSPCLIRSVYHPETLRLDLRARWCYRRATHGLIVVGRVARESARSAGFKADEIAVIEPGVDLERFSPDRRLAPGQKIPGPADGFVAGIVSRIRSTRRLDIPLGALARLYPDHPELRLLIVGHGRSGAYEQVITEPAQRLGISQGLIRAGYCRGDDLVAAYRRMQVLLYPMAGTDKTCRTVREALAAGVPVIAARQGFLTELIQDGQNGYLADPDPAAFAAALEKILLFPEHRQALSQAALSLAQQRFSLPQQAQKTRRFYQDRLTG